MTVEGGFLGLFRQIRDHWVYDDAEYLKAWIEMLLMAQYDVDPQKQLIDKELVTLYRGQFVYGRRSWSKRLGITESRLRTLFEKLEADNMIEIVRKYRRFTVYKLTNYERYNDTVKGSKTSPLNRPQNNHLSDLEPQGADDIVQPAESPAESPASRPPVATLNKDNKENKKSKPTPLEGDVPPMEEWMAQFKILWDEYPKKAGVADAQKWYKQYYFQDCKGKVDFDFVHGRIKAYKEYCKLTERKFKDGSTFFYRRSWNEDWDQLLRDEQAAQHKGPRERPMPDVVELTPEERSEMDAIYELERKRNLANAN